MSYVVRENFGGDSRLRAKYPSIIETKGVYTATGSQKITGVKLDMEGKEVENIINDFLK